MPLAPATAYNAMKRRPRTNMTLPVARPTTAVDARILANHAICDLLRTVTSTDDSSKFLLV